MTRNHLGDETSPYLLQHKDNPVHWFPWGPAAFALARQHNKPVLLSVGYAACHWCHVMAHESFEDQASADVMNRLFVNIKVDREERPDIDKIYMDAIHSLGEQGGWPLTMFLTPDGYPFWGGTYFPKTPQYGRPSFTQVLTEISRIWNEEHGKVETNAAAIHQALQRTAGTQPTGQLTAETVRDAVNTILRTIDFQHGGLQGAPKFPQASIFSFLWQMHGRDPSGRLRDAVTLTLTHICQGGIYDHLAGGFARYSVDHRWLAPHFEKMLYDNAQLVELLAWVHVQTDCQLFRLRIEETVAWLLKDMITPEGALAASYDADSEGEEGKYYVWQKSEIEMCLGAELSAAFCAAYDISDAGNWEGKNIPNRLHSLELLENAEESPLADARAQLLDARSERIPPGWDDKILADWNGLAISALATAGLLLDRPDWVSRASDAMNVLVRLLWEDGMLYQTHRAGRTQHHATADSYANLITACLSLYQATGDQSHIALAEDLTRSFNATHWNEDRGGYSLSSSKAENLIVRSHYAHDDATPNANATMLRALTNLHLITGNAAYHRQARAIHDAFAAEANRVLVAHAGFIAAFDHFLDPVQAVFTGRIDDPKTAKLRQALLKHAPSSTLLIHADGKASLPDTHIAKTLVDENSAAALYVCKGQTCSLPVTEPEAVATLFE